MSVRRGGILSAVILVPCTFAWSVAPARSMERAASFLVPSFAPAIVSDPTPQTGYLGGEATFTVVASGDGPLSYQWRKDGSNLTDGPGVSGATADALVLSDLAFADAGDYSVVVTNASGSATSADAALTVRLPQGGDLDPSLQRRPMSLQNIVYSVALQPDGRILVAGDFRTTRDGLRRYVARLHEDGTTDLTFGNGLSGPDGWVRAVTLQADGKILIGGYFLTVNGTNHGSIARLHPDGSLDTTFQDQMAGANNYVSALAVQPDGRVLVGGSFTTFNGTARGRIARLNADGSLDTTFQGQGEMGADNVVRSFALQADGKILVGGDFTTMNGVSHLRIVRLLADGTIDPTFQCGTDAPIFPKSVYALTLQSDGRVLVGGGFSTVNGIGQNNIARLNTDGSLDETFLSGANYWVNAIALQPDGKILIAGNFDLVNGTPRGSIARLNADGSLDPTFPGQGESGANAMVRSMVLQPDGAVVVGGDFTTVNGADRPYLARVGSDGSTDPGFTQGPLRTADSASVMALQTDGKVLLAGLYKDPSGVVKRFVRLNGDASFDESFQAAWLIPTGHTIVGLAVQADGRVLLGEYGYVSPPAGAFVRRFNHDGSADPSLQSPSFSGFRPALYTLALQPDGRLLIGGSFTAVAGTAQAFVARLNSNGSLDSTFSCQIAGGTSPRVYAVALQPDGKVLVGGPFTTVNGVARGGIARLLPNGSLDTTFQDGMSGVGSSFSPSIVAFAVQPDGKVLIGGNFTSVNGVARSGLARLNADGSLDAGFENLLSGASSLVVQPDGKILVGGGNSTVPGEPRNGIARLNSDGSIDTTFLHGMLGPDSNVYSVLLQPDSRVLIGGEFIGVNGEIAPGVARFYGEEPTPPAITSQPSDQTSYSGCCAVFRVGASGTPRDYRWRKDGIDLADGGNVSGAASSALSLTNISGADAGTYSVRVSNVLGDASAGATLTIASIPQCQSATCDAALGCVLSDLPDGSACSDGNACTTDDACQAGTCVSSPGMPAEVGGVQFTLSEGEPALTWSPAANAASWSVLRGEASGFPVGPGGGDEMCLASGLPFGLRVWQDPDDPAPRAVFWYLVRGDNACWQGTYGSEGSHGVAAAPRVSTTCP